MDYEYSFSCSDSLSVNFFHFYSLPGYSTIKKTEFPLQIIFCKENQVLCAYFRFFTSIYLGSIPATPIKHSMFYPKTEEMSFAHKTQKTLEKSRVFVSSSLLCKKRGASDGTWTRTSLTHAPQTCLSAYSSTLAFLLCQSIITKRSFKVNCKFWFFFIFYNIVLIDLILAVW